MLWILLTIFGAFMNAIRLALQKQLNDKLSAEIVTWVRYSFGLPFILLYLFCVSRISGNMPSVNAMFALYCLAGGVGQIIGTILLVKLFKHRNFAIGIAYSKTESLQTALIGIIFFSEIVSIVGMVAIILGIIGIIIISLKSSFEQKQSLNFNSKIIALGLGSGLCFAWSGLFIRNASLALASASHMLQAAMTLTVTIIFQAILLGIWISYKNKNDFTQILLNWRISALIGFTSFLGSVGLFTALAMAEAAYVKTVTQIGVVFSIMIMHFYFKEKISRAEIIGTIILIGSIGLLSYFH